MTAIHFSAGAASATKVANCGCVIAAIAPLCSAKYCISAPTDFVFVVTPIAPTAAHANHDSTISGEFSEWMRTRSPLAIPRPASPAASRCTSASSSA